MLYCSLSRASSIWAGVFPTRAARLPTTDGSWVAETRDRVICSVTTLDTSGLPLRSRIRPRVGSMATVRTWLAATASAAAGAWSTWRAHNRRPSRAKSTTTEIPTIRRRRPGRDSVVSGASSIASTEKRLGRILG